MSTSSYGDAMSSSHRRSRLIAKVALISGAVFLPLGSRAVAAEVGPDLAFVPHSTVKLYQVTGDCDWEIWDATISNASPTCKPTRSQTASRADVLGTDVPQVFEHDGEMIITFGDTFGADRVRSPKWIGFQKRFQWKQHDPIGRSKTARVGDGLLIDFFMDGAHALEVLPPPQPDGTPVEMGADDVPSGGVSVNGQIYLGITTGSAAIAKGHIDRSRDYSVLVRFDEITKTFTTGRTISAQPLAYFDRPAFYVGAGDPAGPPPADRGQVVWTFGVSQTAKAIHLSMTPVDEFWTGADAQGRPATRYFAGLDKGMPVWVDSEAEAKPLAIASNPTNPVIPYASVAYSKALKLWLLLYENAGRGPGSGIYETYSAFPWGPWSAPQQIFNACRDQGYGHFMRYYYASPAENDCPAAIPPGPAPVSGGSGPAGPSAGDQEKNVPDTTRGIAYGPAIVDRFTTVEGGKVKLYYMLSTWNPYAVVMMESDFALSCGGADCRAATQNPGEPDQASAGGTQKPK
jgi:hypothetical protein